MLVTPPDRLGKSNKFDVSQIHRYLHQAVYLPNHAAYVDEMLLPRRVMQFESTDIVTMYCYLFCEIKQQLGEVVNPERDMIINAPLPTNFYSFWEISFPLDSESLYKMYYFNHFFYLAIKNYITDWDRFKKEILQPLRIISSSGDYKDESNVFTISLFRDIELEEIKTQFNNFIQQLLDMQQLLDNFEIIDIKYLDAKYFRDPNKIEEIKRRSIRKQFVYEHLLQKTLEKRNDQYSNLTIRSSFWLPSYRPDDSELLQDDSTFMDGYIRLKNVNFKLLAETYLA